MDTRTKSGQEHAIKCLQAAGHDIDINWVMRRPRITRLSNAHELSPRLSTREMDLWLSGYMAGYDAGLAQGVTEGINYQNELAALGPSARVKVAT